MAMRIYGRFLAMGIVLVISVGSMGRGEAAVGGKKPVVQLSLSAIIGNPQFSQMSGAEVSVIGFFFGPRLYLTRDHAQVNDVASSVGVWDETEEADLYTSDCKSNYVRVYGRLTTSKHGQLEISRVSKVLFGGSSKICYINESFER